MVVYMYLVSQQITCSEGWVCGDDSTCYIWDGPHSVTQGVNFWLPSNTQGPFLFLLIEFQVLSFVRMVMIFGNLREFNDVLSLQYGGQ